MNLVLGGDPNIGMGVGNAEGMEEEEGGQDPPGSLTVSQAEMDAIDRLTGLGFPKHKAAEAYFACDKIEELAANFLFDHGFEEDDGS